MPEGTRGGLPAIIPVQVRRTPTAEPVLKKSPLLIVFLTVFIDLLGFGIIMPLLPIYAKLLKADNLTIGLLMASFSAMQFLFAPVWGRLSDRVGRRPILVFGLLGSAVFYALFGYASAIQSLTLLFVARIGAGICGANIATAQAYIADSTTPEKRAGGMALIGAAFGIGFTFGPLLGSFSVGDESGEKMTLSPSVGYVAAGLSFTAFLLSVFMLPESLKPDSTPRARSWFSTGALRDALSIPTMGVLLLTFFLATFAFGHFEGVLSRVTVDVFRFSQRDNFFGFAMVGFTLALAQGVVVRRLGPKLGETTMCVIGIVLMTAGLAAIGWALHNEHLAEAGAAKSELDGWEYAWGLPWFRVLAGSLVALVFGFAFLTPSIQSLISRRSDADKQGGILGLNQSCSALARILGPGLSNVCYDVLPGHTFPFFLAAGVMGLALLLSLRIGSSNLTAAESAAGEAKA